MPLKGLVPGDSDFLSDLHLGDLMVEVPDDESREAGHPGFDYHALYEILEQIKEDHDFEQLMSLLRRQFDETTLSRDLLDGLRRLCDLYQEWRPRPSRPGLILESMAVSWAETVFRNARAVIWAVESGMNEVAASAARVALEHGLYVAVLVRTRESGALLEAREARVTRDLALAIEDAGAAETLGPMMSYIEDALAASGSSHETDWANKVKKVSERVETGGVIYGLYRLLSFQVHPGPFNALTFIFDPESDPLPFAPSANVAHSALAACIWAGWALEEILQVDRFSNIADPLARTFGILHIERPPV